MIFCESCYLKIHIFNSFLQYVDIMKFFKYLIPNCATPAPRTSENPLHCHANEGFRDD